MRTQCLHKNIHKREKAQRERETERERERQRERERERERDRKNERARKEEKIIKKKKRNNVTQVESGLDKAINRVINKTEISKFID